MTKYAEVLEDRMREIVKEEIAKAVDKASVQTLEDIKVWRKWLRDHTDMYLGTVSIEAKYITSFLDKIEALEGLHKDKSVTTKAVRNHIFCPNCDLMIDAKWGSNLCPYCGEIEKKDKVPVIPVLCTYYFKDSQRYCVINGPHTEHKTYASEPIVPHALQEKCARTGCGFVLSAHIDGYCPVGQPTPIQPTKLKFITQKEIEALNKKYEETLGKLE